MLKLDYLSVVRFSGSDAGSFLHGQLSADVLGLDSGDSTFACYCEPKGRVLALMLVHRVGEEYFVIMSRCPGGFSQPASEALCDALRCNDRSIERPHGFGSVCG